MIRFHEEFAVLFDFLHLFLQDEVLAELLRTCKDHIVSFHEHESLLDHKQEEELSEAERKAAWAEYEAEVKSCTLQSTNDHEQGSVWGNHMPLTISQCLTL